MAEDNYINQSDEELAVATQSGDKQAFEEIVRRHETSIYRFLTTKTPRISDAEDLTQDTFVRAYNKIHLYNPDYRLLPWLFTIARRLNIQFYRKRKQENQLKGDLIDTRLPSDRIEQSDSHAAIWETIRDVLPERSASAFWLRYEEDLTLEECAKVLNVTQVHLRVMLHRSRTKLAKHMKSSEFIAEEDSTATSNV